MRGTNVAQDTRTPFIVVGVDGSDTSAHAMRWAAEQARATGAKLLAISVWDIPTGYGWGPDISNLDLAGEALRGLEQTAQRALADLPDAPDVQVESRVEQGHAARVLVAASREAELLVIGNRGRGAFTGMLLGSVSQHCAQNAECPVLIYRDKRD